jgi:transaldolase
MKLSKGSRKYLMDELRVIIDGMGKAKTAEEKLYFFSAVFGATQRIVNIEYDPELTFIYQVVSTSYNTINSNLQIAKSGQGVSTIPKDIFVKLQEAVEKLADAIDKSESTYPVLETISNLAYSTTGNGFYLHLKGIIKI